MSSSAPLPHNPPGARTPHTPSDTDHRQEDKIRGLTLFSLTEKRKITSECLTRVFYQVFDAALNGLRDQLFDPNACRGLVSSMTTLRSPCHS